jgi:hypothetical protein
MFLLDRKKCVWLFHDLNPRIHESVIMSCSKPMIFTKYEINLLCKFLTLFYENCKFVYTPHQSINTMREVWNPQYTMQKGNASQHVYVVNSLMYASLWEIHNQWQKNRELQQDGQTDTVNIHINKAMFSQKLPKTFHSSTVCSKILQLSSWNDSRI